MFIEKSYDSKRSGVDICNLVVNYDSANVYDLALERKSTKAAGKSNATTLQKLPTTRATSCNKQRRGWGKLALVGAEVEQPAGVRATFHGTGWNHNREVSAIC